MFVICCSLLIICCLCLLYVPCICSMMLKFAMCCSLLIMCCSCFATYVAHYLSCVADHVLLLFAHCCSLLIMCCSCLLNVMLFICHSHLLRGAHYSLHEVFSCLLYVANCLLVGRILCVAYNSTFIECISHELNI